MGQERPEAAFSSFEAASRLKPDFTEAVEEGARALHQLKRHAQAVEWMRLLCELKPEPFTRVLLANELLLSEKWAEAADLLASVCTEQPDNPEPCVLRHRALLKLGRHTEALAQADRAMELAGENATTLVLRSVSLDRLGRLDEVLACLDRALALEPARCDVMVNRASVLLQQVRVSEAIAAARAGLQEHPDNADLHWTLAIGLLLLGDYRQGWVESEWRMRSVAFRNKVLDLQQPLWRGESLEGKTIFLHAEQGFGDNIQFVRFVPQVARMAQSVLLLITEALEPLVAGTLPPNCRLLPQHSVLPAIDYHCPLMSLPASLGTTVDTIPAEVPYLHADPAAVHAWGERLDTGCLNVGIAWCGNPGHANDHNRSMSLATFRTLNVPGCRFVTVQPQLRDGDREQLAEWGVFDLGSGLRDFADTAALMQALDLVITVDTSVAHLAGALGRPVWVLLAYMPDWRWMVERADSPWYPTARLYRQPAAGEWSTVLARVRADLAALANAR